MDEAAPSGPSTPAALTEEHASNEPEVASKSPRSASLRSANLNPSVSTNEGSDKGGDEDIKDDSENAKEPLSKKRKLDSSTLPHLEEIVIGHHVYDSRLPVFAKWRKNNAIHLRVPVQLMDTPELIKLWSKHLMQGGQVNIESVKLSPAVFGKTDADFKDLTDRERKRQFILELLEAKVAKKTALESSKGNDRSDSEDFETREAHADHEIHIGCFTQDSSVPVYAMIQHKKLNQKALCFRLEDSSHKHRTQVGWEYIILKKKFAKSNEVETRAFIKGLLLNSNSPAMVGLKEPNLEQRPESGGSTVGYNLSPRAASANDAAVKKCFTELVAAYGKGNTYLNKTIENTIEAAERRSKQQSDKIAQLELNIQDLQATAAAKDEEIVRLQNEAKNKVQTIADVGARAPVEKNVQVSHQAIIVKKASETTSGESHSFASIPVQKPKDLHCGQTIYRMTPPGRENAGIYQERFSRKVFCEGKIYEERTFLHKVTLQVSEMDLAEIVKMDGVDYAQYQRDGKEKFVSVVAPEFVVEHKGKVYVKQVLRVKLDGDDEEQLDDAL